MLHETIVSPKPLSSVHGFPHGRNAVTSLKKNVLGDPFQHTLGFKDKGRQGNAAQIGSRPQLRDYRQQHCCIITISPFAPTKTRGGEDPLFFSPSSTMVSSSSAMESVFTFGTVSPSNGTHQPQQSRYRVCDSQNPFSQSNANHDSKRLSITYYRYSSFQLLG